MGSKTVAAAPNNALIEALRLQLEASVLPGDAPVDKPALDEAAAWLLSAAATRTAGQALVQMESDTSERRLRIAIVNDDKPFLVDSVAATIAALGLGIDRLLHPVVPVERDSAGAIAGLGKAGTAESLIYIETPRADARQRRELAGALHTTLADVHAAVSDWPQLQAAMNSDAAAAAEIDGEAGALLAWLGGGMLTQLAT